MILETPLKDPKVLREMLFRETKVLKLSTIELEESFPLTSQLDEAQRESASDSPEVDLELQDEEREKRERFAAKADDAEVPEYLWFEHLFEDGPCQWEESRRTKLIKVAPFLRQAMLNWWRRKVRRSFEAFLESTYPDLKALNAIPSARMVRNLEGIYAWSDITAGQRVYAKWWRERFTLAGQDLVPGMDAISRASKSSWWNWDDGSQPFHWRWPKDYWATIRDGLPVFFHHKT